MFLKNGFYVLCILLAVTLAAGCNFLGDDKDFGEEIEYTDAELVSWVLSNDSLTALSSVVFSIDQRTNEIYNKDSMDFGTEDRLKEIYLHLKGEEATLDEGEKVFLKAVVTYSSGSGSTGNVLNITPNDTTGIADSTWVVTGDSIEITRPQRIRVYAMDGLTTKEYTVKINIHQVDPDSMVYEKIGDFPEFLSYDNTKAVTFKGKFYVFVATSTHPELYRSDDCINWVKEPLAGLPDDVVIRGIAGVSDSLFAYTESGDLYSTTGNAANWGKVETELKIKSVLGFLLPTATQQSGLSLLAEKDGKLIAAFLSGSQWTEGEEIESNFPIKEFSSLSYEKNKISKLTIVSGESQTGSALNEVWSTQDGLYWARLTSERDYVFQNYPGLEAILYNDEIWLFNSPTIEVGAINPIWYSIDGGVTWAVKATKASPTEAYIIRQGSSVVVDSEGKYFYIIGGKADVSLPEIWRCNLNKKNFKDI
jgi:hypothetical protein